MGLFDPSGGGPLGLSPGRTQKVRVTNTTGGVLLAGTIVVIDIAGAPTIFGDPASGTALILAATAPPLPGQIVAVLAERIEDDETGEVVIRGQVDLAYGTTVSTGAAVMVGAASTGVPATATNRVSGIALETTTAPAAGRVMWNGVEGLGYVAA